ncbi:hypothetical protein SLEP1_g34159 [Rubroshorea leprosula]|uniref:Uncharacterized protein n=1 Tax=Rubroshorea leprosula TaxID=152421 RepID=A0AAV5KIX0_9ROSI|nr:hypothetical protein SLEP1_g34159 [Rubroshorea leprosula]
MDSVEETLTKKLDSKIEEIVTKKLSTVQVETFKETTPHEQDTRPAQTLQLTTAAARDEGRQKGIQDTAGDITKKIKIEVPDFEGKVDPIVFSDWINSMEEYFNWYGAYSDSILCDVIPMKVTHILLGRPWLYDKKCKRKSLNILDKRRARVTTTELPCSYKIAISALQNSRLSFLQQGENDEEQEEEAIQ